MEQPPATTRERMHELDWVRVLVTLNLIPFHAAWLITIVDGFSSVEKGTVAWNLLYGYVRFVSPLHMFLLFLVAGTATFVALRYRSPRQYVMERVGRLLIPLLVFMVLLFPVLGYFFPIGVDFSGIDFLTQFWPLCLVTSFHSPFTGGPNWAHMWFVGYLFIYSLVLLPVLLHVRSGKSPWVEAMTRALTDRGGAIFLLGLPIFLIIAILTPVWPFFEHNLYSDWAYFAYNMVAFGFGFLVAGDPRWARAIDRHAALALALGILFSAGKLIMDFGMPWFSTPAYDLRYVFYSLIAGFNTWFWIVAVLGFARRSLSFTNGFLRYANRISYPFYIFHLVVMVVAGYYIARMGLGVVAEFTVICAVSSLGTVLCCELTKSTRPTCFLFGIK